MSNLQVPADLLERLKANPRHTYDNGLPLSPDEREMLALRLEWLAAEVREQRVLESSWGMDRDIIEDGRFGSAPSSSPRHPGPWKHTVEIQFGS